MLVVYSLTLVAAIAVNAAEFNCLPGQSCWPSLEQWQALNSSLSGRLQVTSPWAESCYNDPNGNACALVKQTNAGFETRTKVYGARPNPAWELCGSVGCAIDPTTLQPVSNDTVCHLGRLSAYYVKAISAQDVAQTVKFIRNHNMRLSIKNSGHDYLGKSSAANSLALWTYNLKNREYHAQWTPTRCKTPHRKPYQNIGIIGAGISAREAYAFFEQYGMLVTVGAVDGVGIAGGFGQVAGHGPLAPAKGLMIDQAVEFDVVTADGQYLTINECNHPDLFWAMRGGGGGTYAVLVNYKFKVHPVEPINVFDFRARLLTPATNITSSRFHRDVVSAIAANTTLWAANNISGYDIFTPASFQSVHTLASADTAKFQSVMSSFKSMLETYPGLNVTWSNYATVQTWTQYSDYTAPYLANTPIGRGVHLASRLVPRTQFATPGSIKKLVDTYLQGLQISLQGGASGLGHIYTTTPVNNNDAEKKTSTHPAWRGASWHVLYPGGFLANTPQSGQDRIINAINNAVAPLEALTPGGGSYANENSWKKENWQDAFWGSNYNKLLQVKNRYDPENLFNCYKCVGWRGAQDPFYSCWYPESNNTKPTLALDPSQNT